MRNNNDCTTTKVTRMSTMMFNFVRRITFGATVSSFPCYANSIPTTLLIDGGIQLNSNKLITIMIIVYQLAVVA